jgi:hypothetical protein
MAETICRAVAPRAGRQARGVAPEHKSEGRRIEPDRRPAAPALARRVAGHARSSSLSLDPRRKPGGMIRIVDDEFMLGDRLAVGKQYQGMIIGVDRL